MKFSPASAKSRVLLCCFAALIAAVPASFAQKDPADGRPPPKPRPTPPVTPAPTPTAVVKPTPPKINFVAPVLPSRNALTGPDQTWGMTGITLIDEMGDINFRRSRDRNRFFHRNKTSAPEGFSVTGPKIEGQERAYKPHKLTIPPNAVIINTSDNLTGGGLIPIAYTSDESGAAQAEDSSAASADHPPIVLQVSAARSNLVLFNQDDQLSCGDIGHGDKTLLMGSVGTTFSTNNKVVYLHAGRLIVDSAHEPVKIATKTVGLKIEPESTVLFEYWPSKPIRIVALAKHHAPPVKVRVSFISGPPVLLEPGQELLVSEHQIDQANLQPHDGVERTVVDESKTLSGGEIIKRSFSVAQLAPKLLLSASQFQLLNGHKKAAYERMLSHIAHTPAPNGVAQEQRTSWTPDPVRMFATDGTELMTGPAGDVSLFSGTMFVKAPPRTLIKTDLNEIHVDRPAVLAVQCKPGSVRVDPCDGQRAVWTLTDRHRIELSPGTELLLTEHTPSSDDAYAPDGIGRRKVTATKLPNGLTVVLSDFSIISMLSTQPHLRMLKKPITPTDSQLVDNVLSTAAILNLTTSSRGGFFAHKGSQE